MTLFEMIYITWMCVLSQNVYFWLSYFSMIDQGHTWNRLNMCTMYQDIRATLDIPWICVPCPRTSEPPQTYLEYVYQFTGHYSHTGNHWICIPCPKTLGSNWTLLNMYTMSQDIKVKLDIIEYVYHVPGH